MFNILKKYRKINPFIKKEEYMKYLLLLILSFNLLATDLPHVNSGSILSAAAFNDLIDQINILNHKKTYKCMILGHEVETRTIDNTDSCNEWITSVEFLSTGKTKIHFNDFGRLPYCTCTVLKNGGTTAVGCSLFDGSSTGISVYTRLGGDPYNRTFIISCGL